MRPWAPSQRRRGERGYVTLFILGIAAAVFMAVAGALQANRLLQESNRRQAGRLQARAALVAVRP